MEVANVHGQSHAREITSSNTRQENEHFTHHSKERVGGIEPLILSIHITVYCCIMQHSSEALGVMVLMS